MTARCPHCHQTYAIERFGVRLSPLKARIIDFIKAGGDLGASSQELRDEIYGPHDPRLAATVRVHIHQINELLEATPWIIKSEHDLQMPRWFLRRRKVRQVA